MKRKDLTGQKFGRLKAIKDIGKRGESRLWLCECDCQQGKFKTATVGDLQSGKVKSCGCLQRQQASISAKKNIDKLIALRDDNISSGTNAGYLKRGTTYKNNTSGHRGIVWSEKRKKWIAKIRFQGKNYYLGAHTDKADAIKARQVAEEKIQQIINQSLK